MLLDYMARRHPRVVREDPIASRTKQLIMSIQALINDNVSSFDQLYKEEAKEIRIPDAVYEDPKSKERSGESQVSMNLPIPDDRSPALVQVKQGDALIKINMQKKSEKHSEQLDYQREVDENIEIPDEEPAGMSEEEVAELNKKQQYYGKMNEFAIHLPAGSKIDIGVFDFLYQSGFKQFSLNLGILQKCCWNVDKCLDILMNEEQLIKDYGVNYKAIM